MENAITAANRRTKFAWAKYYEIANQHHHADFQHYRTLEHAADDREVPAHIKEELKNMAKELKKKWECPICYDFIADEQLVITNCGHYYCAPCLDGWKHHEQEQGKTKWMCGVCRREHKL
jgi:hypothetical protein